MQGPHLFHGIRQLLVLCPDPCQVLWWRRRRRCCRRHRHSCRHRGVEQRHAARAPAGSEPSRDACHEGCHGRRGEQLLPLLPQVYKSIELHLLNKQDCCRRQQRKHQHGVLEGGCAAGAGGGDCWHLQPQRRCCCFCGFCCTMRCMACRLTPDPAPSLGRGFPRMVVRAPAEMGSRPGGSCES